MYSAAYEWRRSVHIDELYETFDWPAAERAFRSYYPTYFHGTDRIGCPVQFHELHKLNLDRVSERSPIPAQAEALKETNRSLHHFGWPTVR